MSPASGESRASATAASGPISVDDHLAACLAAVAPRPPEQVDLLDAVGCVLAADVVAAAPLPPFDASAMDGYAVRRDDLSGAGEGSPVRLPVTGDLPAGAPAPLTLEPGTAIRIMTGGPVPAGADAVVPVEVTDAGGGTDADGGPGTGSVVITEQPRPGAHVRPAGDGVRAGDLLVGAGTRLAPRHVALLAAAGHARASVHPRPRVVVVSTGDELVEVGDPLAFGQVHDSNSLALVAAARAAGAQAERVRAVGDDPGPALLAVLREAAGRADLLVTTGGVSAGAYDVVKAVLSASGDARFVQVAMQPGKPQGLGAVTAPDGREVPVMTLPGNPVSAYVSFEVFVRPALRAMLGHASPSRVPVAATASQGWTSAPGKRQFVRALVTDQGDGEGLSVAPVGGHGSHLVADLAHANALVDVPADATAVSAGEVVRCLLLDDVDVVVADAAAGERLP